VQQRRMIDQSEGDAAHRRQLSAHLDAMLALCETIECRRVRLLAYFGQESTACGNCDTCIAPPESWDGTVPAQKLLSTIVRLDRERGQRYGVAHLVDILVGKQSPRVQELKHESLATFGIGADLSEGEWRTVARQVLAQGYAAVSGDGFGTLVLSQSSAEVLAGRVQVLMRRDPVKAPRASRGRRTVVSDMPQEAVGLFEALRAWRAAQAREQGVPAYVVFNDATLRGIAAVRPSDVDQLAEISGVGAAKLESYGRAVLDVVAAAE
jgi:ATP-dependent DNA helicase RecQ